MEPTYPGAAVKRAGGYDFEIFPNPKPERDYVIRHEVTEGTSVCPKTGQPDFWTLSLVYVADATCVELKSLKLYLQSFRNQGVFYERLCNDICDTLVQLLAPRQLTISMKFSVRGGIYSVVTASYPPEEKA